MCIRDRIVLAIIIAISIPVVFSYSPNPIQFFGMTIFELLDYLTNTIMLPLGGLLITLFGAYKIGYERLQSHLLSSTLAILGSSSGHKS